ncbi:type II secretion system F family protein [Sanguibacter suaedae]|uniref:Type II secretion system F family protein n=1 Tax=Sanguibacter suaedae TaxID=2795737 RepID=A0A934MBA9_9MICO|nr:type II secretion system F family protein [Sanguibacter suaedae]MBI9115121.1 type II secretion system F family protein [Sanguibacter suaedae]
MLGVGILVVVRALRARPVRLDERLAPYLTVPDASSGLLAEAPVSSPFGALERIVAPWLADASRLVERIGSPAAELRRKLARAGRTETPEQFRITQVAWGSVGLALGLALAILLAATRGTPLPVLLLLVVICAVTGVIACDYRLGEQVKRREERMLLEFPTVAELLALSVGAGEGPVGALERVARSARGELTEELARTLADVRSGTPLTQALERLADRTGIASLTRFAEGVSVAVERGTPLADVLRAQAQDVRDSGRRALMELGGKKEVLMLVPVVFLILPVTVAFAVFPSLITLQIGL